MQKPALAESPIHELIRNRWSPRAFAGKPMDDEAVRALKAECIADFKNPDAVGVPIEEEAEIMRKGLHDLEQMIDAAIAQARQG